MLNQRAMEVLEDCGVAPRSRDRSTPAEHMAATAYYAGFAGPGPDYGRRLARLEAWGAGRENENWRAASPWRQLNLPQIRLEPILKAGAEQLSPGRIRFNHELLDLEQDDDGVRALVRDNGTGERVPRALRLPARRGRRTAAARRRSASSYEGLGRRDADGDAARHRRPLALGERPRRPDPLDRLAAGRHAGRDGPDGAGALGTRLRGVGHPPQLPGRRPPRAVRRAGRGRRARGARPARLADDDPQDHALVGRRRDGVVVPRRPRVPARRRRASPPADRRARPHQRDPRRPEPVLEARRRPRRDGVAGAARHLRGRAAPRPTSATRSDRWRTRSTSSRSSPRSASRPRTRRRRTGRACAGSGAGARRTPSTATTSCARCGCSPWSSASSTSSSATRYESAAVVPDGTPRRRPVDDIRVYEPSTRPGAPLPHAWIEDEDGRAPPDQGPGHARPLPAHRGRGRRALVRGRQAAGRDAGHPARRRPDRSHRRRPLRPALMWLRRRGIGRDGAVLVRPDRFVGWRRAGASRATRSTSSPTRSAASSPAPCATSRPPDGNHTRRGL